MLRCAVPLVSLSLVCAGAVSADTGLSFQVSHIVSPNHPSATVEVWAYFDEAPYAFAGVEFDVNATQDVGDFSDPFAILHTLGTRNGEVQPGGDGVAGCLPGQIQAPIGEWYADRSNPILIWRATWSTSDFSPRMIDLSTLTKRYAIYLDYDGNNVLLDGTLEGAGKIKVVPVPGVAVPLAAIGSITLTVRRRRMT